MKWWDTFSGIPNKGIIIVSCAARCSYNLIHILYVGTVNLKIPKLLCSALSVDDSITPREWLYTAYVFEYYIWMHKLHFRKFLFYVC